MGWKSAFIVAWLAVQIALPLRYYLRDDAFDERFAWRMFSPVRPLGCQVAFYDETGGAPRPVELSSRIHAVWISLLQRARPSVVEAFARSYCAERPGTVLRVDLTCSTPDSLHLAVCKAPLDDADHDGVPDAFAEAPDCAGRDAAACFREECGDRDAAACKEARCRTRPFPRDADLCREARP
jgi:hypothetical protein